jgi:putative SOS response-associated peptidase YedK
MCGRYMLVEWEELCARFGITLAEPLLPRYNIAPTQLVPVIVGEDGVPVCKMYRWGLVPFWAKDPSAGPKLINARAETVAEKNSFRESFRRRRCLIPAQGFYEWEKRPAGKIPCLFTCHDGGLFAMAGLWDRWQSADGAVMHTFSIITTEANPLVAPVHNRMPVILERRAEEIWLNGDAELKALQELLVPYPARNMARREVSLRVNSPRYDAADILTPDL